MKLKEALGIDVSKNTIDAHIFIKKISSNFSNDKKGFKELFKWLKHHKVNLSNLIICFEHTGIYSVQLAMFLESINQPYSLIPGIEIKKSLGMVRGKNDVVDAIRIAEYAHMRRDTLKQYILPTKSVQKLQKLNTVRAKMIKHRTSYITNIKELKSVFSITENKVLFKEQESLKQKFNKAIKNIEAEILKIIRSDNELVKIYNLISTVSGVGPVLAVNFIINTNGFTTFTDSRKFACYCGIVPFTYQSGTSLKSASKVSHYADKKMKALLNLAAFSAIQCNKEMKLYYERRVKEGKSKMSTINIIRNKIVHRVFAVVKRGTPYVELSTFAA
jgi:transposase